jgi:hypothetical protein
MGITLMRSVFLWVIGAPLGDVAGGSLTQLRRGFELPERGEAVYK